MPLPSLTQATYTLALPSTGEKIKYRPYTVGEEKALLMATENTDEAAVVGAVDQVVQACTFDRVSVDTHPLFDIQYVFLHIRAKSVGEVADFTLICGECEHKTPAQVRLDDVTVKKTEGHSTKVMLTDTLGVVMRYPKVEELAMIAAATDVIDIFKVVAACMAQVFTDDEVYDAAEETVEERLQFLDNLTTEQFVKLRTFFETMPRLEHTVTFTCPKCTKENVVRIEGVQSFFG